MRTSTKMKRKLREEYPEAKFKLRKNTFSGGKSFTVYTDLLEEPDRERHRELDRKLTEERLRGEELEEFEEIEDVMERNRETKRRIKELLADFWHVDRNERGEIMLGGNTYLDVERWEKTEYLS